ncbi:hypothetical protein H7U19_07520 [Hyunsoonleella sp. SJ7]|uniref:Uncharacterized protein n=1 Tax=Hyunsoonleella aquatilis TaxID=2762758 RepID=A0A923HAP5_9FLAO|nr:hypothetical protein [Hyunsoonleella aquatilis]MBC3758247.1 hypothetical protein [Hyunsoonleella aquatilis]
MILNVTDISSKFKLAQTTVRLLYWFPYGITAIFALFLGLNPTRRLALFLLKENSLVENLTFLAFMVGCILGLKLSLKFHQRAQNKVLKWLIVLISIAFFIIAMEEISWGQQFLKFETPEWMGGMNAQNELTVHNISTFQGKSEILRLLFGLAGLVGIGLNRNKFFQRVAVPYVLISFVIVIIVISVFDVYDDFYPISQQLSTGVQRLSELVEMLIAFLGCLYMWLLLRSNDS